jgi:class 3 adenylate cyclase/tetratricopeptide (TPR) repeat protein
VQPVSGPHTDAPGSELLPFLPRLTVEWLADFPERRWLEREGTLAFVDISGFTALSERLSSLGRAGAEEVTDVMNATFARLLAEAYAFGGGLLKFGGDALLLFFDGAGHAQRAAAAAVAVRDALAEIARPQTSAGAVDLRMHAGLHSAPFLFFLVGDSHRELLVSGPAATRTVEMEAASEAGEILVSPETAATLPPECLGDEKGGGVLLTSSPGPAEAPAPNPITGDALVLEHAIPPPLRRQLTDVGRFEGEHRNGAIGFLRFTGVDDLLRARGADGAAEALDEVVRVIQRAADEHEVTFLESDVDRDGGRIVLVAGAPQTTGDNDARLLRTLRAVLDTPRTLPLHVGANRGRVFTGQVGAEFRRTYTVLGDTAALAARLMARAEPDQLLAADAVFDRASSHFAATPLEPFHVKGKAEPVQAFSLDAFAATRAPAEGRPKLPFVDRERERAVLNAAVAPVRLGFGSLVELVGEPGLGKSRLTEELRSYCDDMPMLTATCEQYEAATPYHPFRPLLRSLLDVPLNGDPVLNRRSLAERLAAIDPELEPWSPLLAVPLDVEMESTPEVDELEPSFRRARLHGVVGSLLGALLDRPTFLLFEDVHWMDEASSELLRFLATQLSSRPWLSCTTRRPGPGGFSAAEGMPPVPALTLRLEPLPADDARKLVEAASGGTLGDEELAELTARGAGNPLFLQELAVAAGDEETEELPETVEALLATRIDGLAPGDRALLRWASVLGPSFHSTEIRAVLAGDATASSDDEVWDRLAEFVERDPTVAAGFRFRHALIRDAAYEGLSFRRRRELHGRVAEVIEERNAADPFDVAELLSLHFGLAGRWAEAWRYSVEAGRRAAAKWANLEAAEFYRRALDAAGSLADLEPPEVAAVWQRLGACLWLAGRLEEAAAAFADARALLPGDSPAAVDLMRQEGRVYQDLSDLDRAMRLYDDAVESARGVADEGERRHLTLELRLAIAQIHFRQGAFGDAIRGLDGVVREALDSGDHEVLAPAYLNLHLVHSQIGSPERKAYSGLALTLYEELGDLRGQARALNNLGIEAYFDGDWVKARDLYERSGDLFERIGDLTELVGTTYNVAEILADQGRLEDAEKLLETIVRDADAIGQRMLAALARVNLGRVLARTGRFEDAEVLLGEALKQVRELGVASVALEVELRMVELDALRADRPDTVLDRLAPLLAAALGAEGAAPLLALAYRLEGVVLAQRGDVEAARASLGRSADVAREAGARNELAVSLDLLGVLGDERAEAESASLLDAMGVETAARPPLA